MIPKIFFAALVAIVLSVTANAGNHYGIELAPGEVLVSVGGVPCQANPPAVQVTVSGDVAPIRTVTRVGPFRAVTKSVWRPLRAVRSRCASGRCR